MISARREVRFPARRFWEPLIKETLFNSPTPSHAFFGTTQALYNG